MIPHFEKTTETFVSGEGKILNALKRHRGPTDRPKIFNYQKNPLNDFMQRSLILSTLVKSSLAN